MYVLYHFWEIFVFFKYVIGWKTAIKKNNQTQNNALILILFSVSLSKHEKFSLKAFKNICTESFEALVPNSTSYQQEKISSTTYKW